MTVHEAEDIAILESEANRARRAWIRAMVYSERARSEDAWRMEDGTDDDEWLSRYNAVIDAEREAYGALDKAARAFEAAVRRSIK